MSPPGMAPALLTRRSVSGHSAASLSTLRLSERSSGYKRTATLCLATIAPRAASRSAAVRATSTTSQPSSANTSAQARPIPFEAPVTSALRPRNPRSIALLPNPCRSSRILSDLDPGQLVLVVEEVAQLRSWYRGKPACGLVVGPALEFDGADKTAAGPG